MKLTLSTCIFAAVAVALVHGDCTTTSVGLKTCMNTAESQITAAKTNDQKCQALKTGVTCVKAACDDKVPDFVKDNINKDIIPKFNVKNCDPFSSAGMKTAVPATVLIALSLILTIVLRG